MRSLRALDIKTGLRLTDADVFAMAQGHRLTGYDATYGALAAREGAPLATLDKALIVAGQSSAFALWTPT